MLFCFFFYGGAGVRVVENGEEVEWEEKEKLGEDFTKREYISTTLVQIKPIGKMWPLFKHFLRQCVIHKFRKGSFLFSAIIFLTPTLPETLM